MADKKLTALPAKASPASDDLLYLVDVHDTTDDPAGSSKQTTLAALLAGVPSTPGDALSNLSNAINPLTNPSGANLVANTWNVITASSACNAKLPAPTAGHVIGVRVTNGSTNLFTLNPNASEHIQPGANTSRVMFAGESAILVGDGTDWYKLAGLSIPMSALVYLNGAQSVSSGTTTQVLIDTALFDNTGGLMGDTSNSRMKALRGGVYLITGSVCYKDTVNTGKEYQCRLALNVADTSSGLLALDKRIIAASPDFPQANVPVPAKLATGDLITVGAYQNTGGSQSLNNGNGAGTYLSMLEQPTW